MYSIPGFFEPASSLTHFGGACAFLVLSILLLRRSWGRRGLIAYVVVYSITCILLLCMSGAYHSLEPGMGRSVLWRLDQAAIFALIAGTFTAVHGVLLTGWKRWGPLSLVWLGAAVGILLIVVYADDLPRWSKVAMYLALGWFGAVSGFLIWRRHGSQHIVWPFCGGITFTVGALLEFCGQGTLVPHVIGPHELFHFMVLLGMWFFWQCIYEGAASDMQRRNRHQFATAQV